jgi:TonB family protein
LPGGILSALAVKDKNKGIPMRISVRAAGVLLLSCLASTALAEDESVKLDLFTAPKILATPTMPYPSEQRHIGNEGWVQLNFMVSPKGEPYEITVVESTGIEAFEKAAVKMARNWKFEPAKLGGSPIDAGQNMKVVFAITNLENGADDGFVRAYKRLMKAIVADDREKADAELAKLRVHNLYEDAFKNLASFHYHVKWGTPEQQILDLRRAIAAEKAPRYLQKTLFAGALENLMILEIRAQDFARALETWEKLRPVAPAKMQQKWEPAIDEIRGLRASDRAYSMSAHILSGTSWHGRLFKNRFEIQVASGEVSEIKLRCDKSYVFFRYEPKVVYTVESRHGSCDIEVVGAHDSKFSLVQS